MQTWRLSKNPKVIARLDQLTVEKERNKRMFALSYDRQGFKNNLGISDTSGKNAIFFQKQ